MKTDLLASLLPSKEPETLYTFIDKHAQLHTKHSKAKYIPGSINENVIAANETKRLFKRIWPRNKSTFNRSQYMQKVHQFNRIHMQAKSQFLKARFQDNHHNLQKLWHVLGDVLHRLPTKILPSIKPRQLLVDRFVEFFTEKIEKNTLNILCFPQFATHHPRLYSPYVFHFLYCNRGSSYQNYYQFSK